MRIAVLATLRLDQESARARSAGSVEGRRGRGEEAAEKVTVREGGWYGGGLAAKVAGE